MVWADIWATAVCVVHLHLGNRRPADRTLLEGSGGNTYVVEGGLKSRMSDGAAFTACGYLSGNVNEVADSYLAAILNGDDVTASTCP